jgi:hypothetical protein
MIYHTNIVGENIGKYFIMYTYLLFEEKGQINGVFVGK